MGNFLLRLLGVALIFVGFVMYGTATLMLLSDPTTADETWMWLVAAPLVLSGYLVGRASGDYSTRRKLAEIDNRLRQMTRWTVRLTQVDR
jgi:hypothetical protein